MVIISKCKSIIVNLDNITSVAMDDDKKEIIADTGLMEITIGRYEDEEVTKTVFNQLIEAIENCEEVFHMPE